VRAGVDPQRAAEKIALFEGDGGVVIDENNKVVGISSPSERTAYGRLVRLHELIHAKHSQNRKRKYSDVRVGQGIEDVKVHTIWWPAELPEQLVKDAYKVAKHSLRKALKLKNLIQKEPEVHNSMLVESLRAWAILSKLKRIGGRDMLNNGFYQGIDKCFDVIISTVSVYRKFDIAEDLFASLFRWPDSPHGNFPEFGSDKKEEGIVKIIELEHTERCRDSRAYSPSRSGARIYRSRLVRAVVCGQSYGLFRKKRAVEPLGTTLIDASGSMSLTLEKLCQLCAAAPGADVAYYSGRDNTGEIVIFAKNGFRSAKVRETLGSNVIDLNAMLWLLRQPEPRVIVTDGKFCGGKLGQDEAAKAILHREHSAGRLTWLKSFNEAIKWFDRG
jgi:hypothetical protein